MNMLTPKSEEAEMAVLGSMLINEESIEKVYGTLSDNDFFFPKNKIIYNTIIELHKKGKTVDIMTISDRLTETSKLSKVGGDSYLAELMDSVPTSSHIKEYADILVEKKIRRGIILTSSKLQELAGSYEFTLDDSMKYINSIQKSIEKYMYRDEEEVNIKLNRDPAFTWGTIGLDKNLPLFKKGSMMVVYAKSKTGKTTWCFNMARRNADGFHYGMRRKVIYFSLEMTAEEMMDRLAKDVAGISDEEDKKGAADKIKESIYEREMNRLVNYENFKIMGSKIGEKKSVESIMAKISSYSPDLVFIDSLGLIERDGQKSVFDEQDRITQELVNYAQSRKIGIVLIHHTNKDGIFEGSQKISNNAQGMVELERSVLAEEDDDPKEKCKLIATGINARFGKYIGTCEVFLHKGDYSDEYIPYSGGAYNPDHNTIKSEEVNRLFEN